MSQISGLKQKHYSKIRNMYLNNDTSIALHGQGF